MHRFIEFPCQYVMFGVVFGVMFGVMFVRCYAPLYRVMFGVVFASETEVRVMFGVMFGYIVLCLCSCSVCSVLCSIAQNPQRVFGVRPTLLGSSPAIFGIFLFGFQPKMGPANPKCQSRNIANWGFRERCTESASPT